MKNNKKKLKKVNNGIGDLRFVAAFFATLGIITIVLNIWNTITVSVDAYIENNNDNIVEYTKNFIENSSNDDIDRNDIEYIETEKDAKIYMLSYVYDNIVYIIITVVGTIGFCRLVTFYNKENMENPYDEKVVESLRKTSKFIEKPIIIWLIAEILIGFLATVAATYSSSMFFDILVYTASASFIRFIIFILEKGKLKSNEKE